MINLFESKKFRIEDINTTGKKQMRGSVTFKGFESDEGGVFNILATEYGIVMFAGRAAQGTRSARYGVHVRVNCRNGIEMIYANLDTRLVKAGDYVDAGKPIGVQHEGRVTIECRRNGRRVDACEVLSISPEQQKIGAIFDFREFSSQQKMSIPEIIFRLENLQAYSIHREDAKALGSAIELLEKL
ncbi:MAG: M23 family metallopeptidase [Clostridiales bacterium]|nr:M23 family metallopeptidase [Clostridiales bacterium]